MIASQITCPVCNNGDPKGDKAHDSGARMVGFAQLACPGLETADVKFYPKWEPAVIVVGAGEWVDKVPPKPDTALPITRTAADLQREIDSLKEAGRVKDLQAELDALKARDAKPAETEPAK